MGRLLWCKSHTKKLELIRGFKMPYPTGEDVGSLGTPLLVANVLINTFARESTITPKSPMWSILVEVCTLQKGILHIVDNVGKDIKR